VVHATPFEVSGSNHHGPATCSYYAPSPFACTWQEGGSGAAWVRVAGELDLASAPRLRQTLRVAQLYARVVVLDLRELTFMDSSGVHVILDADADDRRASGRLILVRAPTLVDRVFTLTGASNQLLLFELDPAEPPAQGLLHLAQERAVT
jgi:anti-sigma B factor antagonist